jgi:hypothetical protein
LTLWPSRDEMGAACSCGEGSAGRRERIEKKQRQQIAKQKQAIADKEAQAAKANAELEAAMLLQRAAAAHLALTEPIKPPTLSIPTISDQPNVVEAVIETARGLVKGASDIVAGALGLANEGSDDPPVASRGGGARVQGLAIPAKKEDAEGNLFEQGLNSARQLITQVASGFSRGSAEDLASQLEADQKIVVTPATEEELEPKLEIQPVEAAAAPVAAKNTHAPDPAAAERTPAPAPAAASVAPSAAVSVDTVPLEVKEPTAVSPPATASTAANKPVSTAPRAPTAPSDTKTAFTAETMSVPSASANPSDSAAPTNAFGVKLRSSKRASEPAVAPETTQML